MIVIWGVLTHLAAIYLFTRGFLLTRLSLPNIAAPAPPLLKTHDRAILVLIDSLRFDFIAPHPPAPPNPFHHNVLTLPRDLTATRPRYSFIFNAYSDPPTTTLQRIKGITTGSLPTFVDIGSNFGASHVAEDSLLEQLSLHAKKVPPSLSSPLVLIPPASLYGRRHLALRLSLHLFPEPHLSL
jgi:phosphatidylinositol glycan class O